MRFSKPDLMGRARSETLAVALRARCSDTSANVLPKHHALRTQELGDRSLVGDPAPATELRRFECCRPVATRIASRTLRPRAIQAA